LAKLETACQNVDPTNANFWAQTAKAVGGGKTPEECGEKYQEIILKGSLRLFTI